MGSSSQVIGKGRKLQLVLKAAVGLTPPASALLSLSGLELVCLECVILHAGNCSHIITSELSKLPSVTVVWPGFVL